MHVRGFVRVASACACNKRARAYLFVCACLFVRACVKTGVGPTCIRSFNFHCGAACSL